MGWTGEIVFLSTTVKVGQSIIISAFYQKVSSFGTKLYTGPARNTIVKLVIYSFVVLLNGYSRIIVPVTANCITVS